ncbi:winged helix DNA-binding domain-containing protein [Rubrolithibacter danxiaensis]|uniref:winged helix DNA-binding domain-containing protein n=1 Tax=Rubrolithibacter danxiaensis TaxID=3390805 RepID=UPI003BF8BDC8
MTASDIIRLRLINQQIGGTLFQKPAEVVTWLGAMQAQEYAMAKWAISLRSPKLKDAVIEQAFNEGEILRTHLLRPTWHFVSPQDIRWLLALTAPRVNAANAHMYRKLELDTELFNRTNTILVKALEGGNQLTREKIRILFEEQKISASGTRLACILMRAELEGIICSGARQGKQFTYALLEERVAPAPSLHREEALAELSTRYFTSRGPATAEDFAWWSGLTAKDAKAGVEMLDSNFLNLKIENKSYYYKPPLEVFKPQSTFLMPDYDEYVIGYKDRSSVFEENSERGRGAMIFNHTLIVEGKSAGTWKKTSKGKAVEVEIFPFAPLNKTGIGAVNKAIKQFYEFCGNNQSAQ